MARSPWLLSAAVLVSLCTARPVLAAPTPVTSCDIAYRGTAYLTGDVDCTSSSLGRLVFDGRGRLLLNGFTLTGGVSCTTCNVIGPGTITGSSGAGVQAVIRANVRGVTITGNATGIAAHRTPATATVYARESVITGNLFHGIDTDLRAKLKESSVTNNGLNGVNVPCLGNSKITVLDSTLSGNGTDPVCGDTITCADLATCKKPPSLNRDSTCETSYVLGTGFPGTSFGICSLD